MTLERHPPARMISPRTGTGPTRRATTGFERAGTLLVAVGMLMAPLSSLQPVTPPPVITYADVFFVLGFLLLAPAMASRPLEIPLPFIVGALTLLSAALVAVAVTAEPSVSIPGVVRLTYASILLPLAVLVWRPPPRRVALLASAYLVGALVSLTCALISGPTLEGRYLGLTPHPNSFGHSMAFAAALVPYLASTQPARRWWYYAAGAACFYGIWLSGSRASLIAFFLVALVYPVVERSVRAAAVVLYSSLILVLAWSQLANAGGSNAFARLLGEGSATEADEQRLLRLDIGLHEFVKHPVLGSGFEQLREAHNIYLQVLIAVGIFGLIGFLLLLSALVVPLFTVRGPGHRLAYPALLFVFLGPLTDVLWDTLPWAVLSLAMLARDGTDGRTSIQPRGHEAARQEETA